MPFWFGAMGSHDDSSHQGSAKRDTANGLCGLDGSGNALVSQAAPRTVQAMKDVASGIAGLSAQLGVSSKIYAALNFLHIFDLLISSNTLAGTGTVTQDPAVGTITCNAPAGNDIADRAQNAKTAFGTRPRVMTFRISAISVTGNTQISIGYTDAGGTHYARLDYNGTNWNLATKAGGAETRSGNLTAPVAGDIFIIYATSAVVALYKNGVAQAANVATLPTNAVGMDMFASPALGANSGSFTLDMLSEQ